MGRMLFVPYFIGARTRDGARLAPADVVEPALPEGSPQERLGVLYKELARCVRAIEDARVQAGDCTASIGVVAGLQARGVDPAVVWLDAHGDFNTWETTPSGFLGGMPLAMLAGLGEQTIVEAAGQRPIASNRLLLVGARDLDPGEEANLERARVRQVAVEELTPAALPEGALYLHLDTDVVRLEEMPAVNYPAPGGPGADAVRAALEAVVATGRVAAISYTGWDPNLPGAELSAATARRMLQGLLF
jgi:arginase